MAKANARMNFLNSEAPAAAKSAKKRPCGEQKENAGDNAAKAAKGGKGKEKKPKDVNAPKRQTSAYIFFSIDPEVREAIKRENPTISKSELASLLGAKWKSLSEEEKQPYEEKAAEDKARYQREKAAYEPPDGAHGKKKKDPNAPASAKTAYQFFIHEQRLKLQEEEPGLPFGEANKKLGAMWKSLSGEDRAPFEEQAREEKERYAAEWAEYALKNPEAAEAAKAKRGKGSAQKKAAAAPPPEDDRDELEDDAEGHEEDEGEEHGEGFMNAECGAEGEAEWQEEGEEDGEAEYEAPPPAAVKPALAARVAPSARAKQPAPAPPPQRASTGSSSRTSEAAPVVLDSEDEEEAAKPQAGHEGEGEEAGEAEREAEEKRRAEEERRRRAEEAEKKKKADQARQQQQQQQAATAAAQRTSAELKRKPQPEKPAPAAAPSAVSKKPRPNGVVSAETPLVSPAFEIPADKPFWIVRKGETITVSLQRPPEDRVKYSLEVIPPEGQKWVIVTPAGPPHHVPSIRFP